MEKAHTLGEVWGARWARLRRGPAKREEIHRPPEQSVNLRLRA